jgi:manganese/zinc/iron transport system substrate-binding protein
MTFTRFRRLPLLAILALGLILAACDDDSNGATSDNGDDAAANGDDPIHAISTTTWLHDAVSSVGGDLVEAEALMGPGIDPHDYVATEGDLTRMERADIIFYNGHHLEGAMSNVLGQVDQERRTLAVAEQIDDDLLLEPDLDLLGDDFDAPYDPHIWFDIDLWKLATEIIRDEFIDLDPDNEDTYRENADAYIAELDELDEYVQERIQEIPEEKRILITAHDAFGYFGRAFDMEVRGLQPVTTDVEAAASDIRELADLIVEREIPALFLETAVPPQGIEAVQAAVLDRGFDVQIADDELFGDALGQEDTDEGTYVGAYRFNVNAIVDALTAG